MLGNCGVCGDLGEEVVVETGGGPRFILKLEFGGADSVIGVEMEVNHLHGEHLGAGGWLLQEQAHVIMLLVR